MIISKIATTPMSRIKIDYLTSMLGTAEREIGRGTGSGMGSRGFSRKSDRMSESIKGSEETCEKYTERFLVVSSGITD